MTKKRAKDAKRVNGSGSISELEDGRFLAVVEVDGRRVYRYRKTRLEAGTVLAGLITGTEPKEARKRVALPKQRFHETGITPGIRYGIMGSTDYLSRWG